MEMIALFLLFYRPNLILDIAIRDNCAILLILFETDAKKTCRVNSFTNIITLILG